jgi:hypothetical protein
MPTRSASLTDSVYQDIHDEMGVTGKTFSQVMNRRLEKLIEIESKEVKKE